MIPLCARNGAKPSFPFQPKPQIGRRGCTARHVYVSGLHCRTYIHVPKLHKQDRARQNLPTPADRNTDGTGHHTTHLFVFEGSSSFSNRFSTFMARTRTGSSLLFVPLVFVAGNTSVSIRDPLQPCSIGTFH